MDFYDSIYQYDLEVQNKIEERINSFIKSINLLKNESIIKYPNTKDSKYKHINNLIDEINTSNKFKQKLKSNQKKNLLLRMNNKNKINSKYYIYAKDMNQDNQKIDIIEIENTLNQRESGIEPKKEEQPYLELEKCFNQQKINYDKNNEKEKQIISEEENNFNQIKSDINKIVCDIIKQNVKNAYNHKINEIFSNHVIESKTINLNIKNNNYVKIDLPKKDYIFRDTKEGKENKKIYNNHSSDKNANYKNFFHDNNKKNVKKELRNSVTNNNPGHLKIKVYKNDILNFNNLNNNNINNILIINNKGKNTRNEHNMNMGNIHSKRVENNNKKTLKGTLNQEMEVAIMNSGRNDIDSKNNNKENDEKNNNKNQEQNHKRMIVRNIQRIQIKNIKLKNNPTGYNLTNICKKKLIDIENPEKNMKKSRPKNRQCASPGDIGLTNKKINILKFKLGKNEPITNRKNTEKSGKKNKNEENGNNSIILINDNKTKEKYSHPVQYSSIKNKQIKDELIGNDILDISKSKIDNNFVIRNYKPNINKNNNIIYNNYNNNNYNNNNHIASIRNSFAKDSENENYFLVNRNNMKKSLSKESGSHSYLPWNPENGNSIINKSNNKTNLADSFLNMVKQIDKKNTKDNKINNINEYKKINKKNSNNKKHLHNDIISQNNELNNGYTFEQKYDDYQIKSKRINEIINNNNFKERRNGGKVGYNDTIYNKEEPISYREGEKIKSRRRILSTKVHIRGVNSSKNFNNIF